MPVALRSKTQHNTAAKNTVNQVFTISLTFFNSLSILLWCKDTYCFVGTLLCNISLTTTPNNNKISMPEAILE